MACLQANEQYGHERTSHRAAAMLSMQSTVVQELPARAHRRVSDLVLPGVPESPDGILPVPEGVNELICLQVWPRLQHRTEMQRGRMYCCCPDILSPWPGVQDAVTSVSHEKFTTHYAKLGWRKWAMMMANANVMVDLFWWISATFFRKVRSLLHAASSKAGLASELCSINTVLIYPAFPYPLLSRAQEDANAAGLRTFLYHRFSRHFINLLIVDAEVRA